MREVRCGLLYTCFMELVCFHDRSRNRDFFFPGTTPFEAFSPLRNIFIFRDRCRENSEAFS